MIRSASAGSCWRCFEASDAPSRSISIISASTRKPIKKFCIRLSSLIAKTSARNFLLALKRFRLLTADGRAVSAAEPSNQGSASSSSAKPTALHHQPSTVCGEISHLRHTCSWSHARVPVEHFSNQLSSLRSDVRPFTTRIIHLMHRSQYETRSDTTK